jgi:hypothetical protein
MLRAADKRLLTSQQGLSSMELLNWISGCSCRSNKNIVRCRIVVLEWEVKQSLIRHGKRYY